MGDAFGAGIVYHLSKHELEAMDREKAAQEAAELAADAQGRRKSSVMDPATGRRTLVYAEPSVPTIPEKNNGSLNYSSSGQPNNSETQI